MRIMLITDDNSLIGMAENIGALKDSELKVFNDSNDPFDVLTFTYTETPSIVIIDDDFLSPNSVSIIKMLKRLNKDISIIFFTSDSSLELGKKVTPLGILFYGIKPIDKSEFNELINSIIESKKKLHTSTNN